MKKLKIIEKLSKLYGFATIVVKRKNTHNEKISESILKSTKVFTLRKGLWIKIFGI